MKNKLNTLIAVLFLFFLINQNLFAQKADSVTTKKSSSKTITLTVTGMGCSKDNKLVENALYQKKGVSFVAIKGDKIAIKFNEQKIRKEDLISAIESVGTCEDKEDKTHKVTE